MFRVLFYGKKHENQIMKRSAEKTYSIYVSPKGKVASVKNGWSGIAMFLGFALGEWCSVILNVILINIPVLSSARPPRFGEFLDLLMVAVFGYFWNGWTEKILLRRGYKLKAKVKANSRNDAVDKFKKVPEADQEGGGMLPPPLPPRESSQRNPAGKPPKDVDIRPITILSSSSCGQENNVATHAPECGSLLTPITEGKTCMKSSSWGGGIFVLAMLSVGIRQASNSEYILPIVMITLAVIASITVIYFVARKVHHILKDTDSASSPNSNSSERFYSQAVPAQKGGAHEVELLDPETSEEIIGCPSCGALNRVSCRTSNQRPICGRCKALIVPFPALQSIIQVPEKSNVEMSINQLTINTGNTFNAIPNIPHQRNGMNLSQLTVLWYAIIIIVAACFLSGEAGMAVVGVCIFSAALIYTLKPHPGAASRKLVKTVLLPCFILVLIFGLGSALIILGGDVAAPLSHIQYYADGAIDADQLSDFALLTGRLKNDWSHTITKVTCQVILRNRFGFPLIDATYDARCSISAGSEGTYVIFISGDKVEQIRNRGEGCHLSMKVVNVRGSLLPWE